MKVLLENLVRLENGRAVTVDDIKAVGQWLAAKTSDREIAFRPARVLMQDLTGVPAVVDLAAMRQAMVDLGGDPNKINPLSPVDLVIDHSVQIDNFGNPQAFAANVKKEFERNGERYRFLAWGQPAFENFRLVPPGTGICHQVNLEYLSQVVWTTEEVGKTIAYPDTLVGTDSHTTMVNGLSVLGWGVGGIEAEAAMLGQPISMLIPEVVGVRLTGRMAEGATATDLVLTITQLLRRRGVVGRFVEYCGPGVAELALADRATIGNMSPEYGATCGFFPIDAETIRYLTLTARDPARVNLVEAYAKVQGLWRDANTPDPVFTDLLELDLGSVEPSLAGPRRPQDRVSLSGAGTGFDAELPRLAGVSAPRTQKVEGTNYDLHDGDVVIAAITSCTNTSNPSVMLGAGLLAKKAVERGLKVRPTVKTSLAPGSRVVTEYLEKTGLQPYLNQLGFNLVGYGCTTCIGNSGPLDPTIEDIVNDHDLIAASVLSGNRNFEARVHQSIKANFLMSPPLVVAFALAGTVEKDLSQEPLGQNDKGEDVYLRDIWPTMEEIGARMSEALDAETFRRLYGNFAEQNPMWNSIPTSSGLTYQWDQNSTYIQEPPFFAGFGAEVGEMEDIHGARPLAIFGDSVTTDHISPAGAIKATSPAGVYLQQRRVDVQDFNSYGSRRGNHEVMMRGTFANVRIKNLMVPGTEGGVTLHQPDGERMSIYDAAMKYQEEKIPLVVIAGQEYGTGSSRDWAAKGTRLLGVKAVIAQSFERIHRSNLVGMGVLRCQLKEGINAASLHLDGSDTSDITGLENVEVQPRQDVTFTIHRADDSSEEVPLTLRIDTPIEIDYYLHGGILPYVWRKLLAATTV